MGRVKMSEEFRASVAAPQGARDNHCSNDCTSRLYALNVETSMVGESDPRAGASDQNDPCPKDMNEDKQMAKRAKRHLGEIGVRFITTGLILFNSSTEDVSFAWVPQRLRCILSAIPAAPGLVREDRGPIAETPRQTRA